MISASDRIVWLHGVRSLSEDEGKGFPCSSRWCLSSVFCDVKNLECSVTFLMSENIALNFLCYDECLVLIFCSPEVDKRMLTAWVKSVLVIAKKG